MCQQAQIEGGHEELRPIILIWLILTKPHIQPKGVNILLLVHQYDTFTTPDVLSLRMFLLKKKAFPSSLSQKKFQNSDLTKMLSTLGATEKAEPLLV